MTALVLPALPDGVDVYVGTIPAPAHLFLERPAGNGTGIEYDPSVWPTWDQIMADTEWDEIVRHLQDASDTARAVREEYARALADVAEAVELAAVPVTGAIPISVPLTKTDAHDGTVEAVITHVCARLREIARTRRTSELPNVIATLEAVV